MLVYVRIKINAEGPEPIFNLIQVRLTSNTESIFPTLSVSIWAKTSQNMPKDKVFKFFTILSLDSTPTNE